MVAGIALIGLELTFDTAFYLMFLGVAAFLVGSVEWAYGGMSESSSWLLFSVFSVASLLLFRKKLYDRVHKHSELVKANAAVGARVRLTADLPRGHKTRVDYQGTSWTAVNVGGETLKGGEYAIVRSLVGVELQVVRSSEGVLDAFHF